MKSKKRIVVALVVAICAVALLTLSVVGCSNVASAPSGGDSGSDDGVAPAYRELSTAQVSDIIFKNGKVLSAAEITAALKNDAIAVVYKVDAANKKAYAVGKMHERNGKAWAMDSATGCSTEITNLVTTVSGSAGNLTFEGYKDGSTGLSELKKVATDYSETNYPAWAWVEKYGATNCAGTAFTNGWYFPSVAELFDIWKNKTSVEASLKEAGGSKFSTSWSCYWSSSLYAPNGGDTALILDFGSGDWNDFGKLIDGSYVCAVRAFTY